MSVWAQHSITGKVVEVGKDIPEEYLEHPVFGQWYTVVDSPEGCVSCGPEEEPVAEEEAVEEPLSSDDFEYVDPEDEEE